MNDDGVAKLCDFGLALLPEWQVPMPLTAVSVYSNRGVYTAPELFAKSSHYPVATFESDIYSLGCILLKVRRLWRD